MTISLVLKLFHILTAFWMIAGTIGRGVTFQQAARAANVYAMSSLLQASDFFERSMVIPGSMAVFLLGLGTAWAQGWPLFGFLQGARTNWLLLSIVLYLLLMPPLPLYLIPRRKQRARAMEEALAEGKVTPDLLAAATDKGVIAFRTYEITIVVLITILMVTKPF